MKDHKKRELVNSLHDCAVKFHNHQSLRERIAHIVLPVMEINDRTEMCVIACAGLREEELIGGVVPAGNFIKMREQRDELQSRLESAEFWQGTYPEGWTAKRVENEMTDFYALMDGIPSLYMHITGGKVSKELTDKSVIKSLHDDYVTELVEEETKELEQQRDDAQQQERIAIANATGMREWKERILKAANDLFHCKADRFKLCLRKNGTASNVFPRELDGAWVSFQRAEDDGHIGLVAQRDELQRINTLLFQDAYSVYTDACESAGHDPEPMEVWKEKYLRVIERQTKAKGGAA